jgi:glycine dehydrogenase subunit 1
MIYLSWLGRQGLVELGELLVQRTHYARERLCGLEGVEALHGAPVVREFAVELDAPVEAVVERCAERGIAAGVPLGAEYGENALLIAITELRTKADIDRLAEVLGEAVTSGQRAAGSEQPAGVAS